MVDGANVAQPDRAQVMIRLLGLMILALCASISSAALAWQEPQRGSATRAALMDAIRPHVEWELGQPVVFVVDELRVAGDVGLAFLSPQRPQAMPINLQSTPGMRRGSLEPDQMDGVAVAVLYRKLRNTWVAVHHSIGATDLWIASDEYCQEYRPVLSDFCR